MKRPLAATALALCSLVATGLAQQPASPVAAALRSRAERAGRNLVAAAEQMPADRYGFKPTAAQMSFGEVVAHVAAGSDALCSSIGGVAAPKRAEPAAGAAKDQLVSRLREAFRYCESALARVDDTMLSDEVPYFGAGQISRADAMFAAAEEWAGHYSQLAVYFRLNGLLPPTARR
ncbi:MAG TPA: DinB family protein [Gemmatimonadales bacterium]